MKNIFFISLLMGMSLQLFAQIPKVPSNIEFAGMDLHLNKSAQKKIQEDVNKLCKNPTYFQKYVDQADIYFPLIEKVFAEEKFPDEIKYLVIQESAFRSEAVSSSNAVGYWQFKKATGLEVGLRIKGRIDERKNIERASRGAAIYMTKNNSKLDNWIHALTSYNTGLGGVQRYVDKKDIGAQKMYITARTHWYFLKFLAHKIAFQNAIGKKKPSISLLVDKNQGGKKLKEISKRYKISLNDLVFYNKWIGQNSKVPTDGEYSVIVPVAYDGQTLANNSSTKKKHKHHKKRKHIDSSENEIQEVNGVEGLVAIEGDNAARLAIKAGITRKQFLVYNEMESFEKLKVGQLYYVHAKRRKAEIPKHTVQEGETLKEIAQKYAVKERAIRSKNRMRSNEALIKGRVLWLRSKRPRNTAIEYDSNVNPDVKVTTKEQEKTSEKVTEINENELIDEVEEVQSKKKEKVVVNKEMKDDEFVPVKESTTVIKKQEIKQNNSSDNQEQEGLSQTTTVIQKADKLVINVTQEGKGNLQNAKIIIHTVTQGQTLYAISKLHKVTVYQIIEWNNLTNPALSLGQKLVIHSTKVKELQTETEKKSENIKKYVYHIVQKGETIYKISKQYKITPAQIMEWNQKTESSLSIGEKLVVKVIK